MFKYLKDKLSRHKSDPFKKEGLRICAIYFVIGLFWIYFSDRIVNYLFKEEHIILKVNTYKGTAYVFCTALILYFLISELLRKVEMMKKRLNESYDELSASNEELQSYVEELTASDEELRTQYEQIVEYGEKLRVSEEKYKSLITEMQLGLALYAGNPGDDLYHYKVVDTNYSHEVLTGFKQKDIMGKYFHEIHANMEPENAEKLIHTITTGEPTRYERLQKKTNYYYEIIAYRPMDNQLAIIVNDITKRKQAEGRLNFLSYHDQLTGLFNRRFFEQELVALDKDENYPLMITMIDINGLKLVNDSFGHATGDKYIQMVAKVLIENTRDQDVVCRQAGDEFIIFSPKTDDAQMQKIIEDMNEAARKMDVNSVPLSLSFGYCAKKSSDEPLLEVMKRAERYMYKKKLLESSSVKGKTVYTIMTTLHEKNPREEQHSRRVSQLCEKMGVAMGLRDDEVKELRTVGLLHDIGKVAIEEGILNKPGKLDEMEWEEIKKHPEIGYRILSTVSDLSELSEYVLSHHERWDGKGYPRGLKGEDIPLQSRIIAIADAYDAMRSERSYRKALSKEYAVSELEKGAGTQFNESCVNVFIEKVVKDDDIYECDLCSV